MWVDLSTEEDNYWRSRSKLIEIKTIKDISTDIDSKEQSSDRLEAVCLFILKLQHSGFSCHLMGKLPLPRRKGEFCGHTLKMDLDWAHGHLVVRNKVPRTTTRGKRRHRASSETGGRTGTAADLSCLQCNVVQGVKRRLSGTGKDRFMEAARFLGWYFLTLRDKGLVLC